MHEASRSWRLARARGAPAVGGHAAVGSAVAGVDRGRAAHPPGTRLLRRGVRGDGAAQARLRRRPARGLRSHRPGPAARARRLHRGAETRDRRVRVSQRAGLVQGPGRQRGRRAGTPPPGAVRRHRARRPVDRLHALRSQPGRARALSPGARLRPRDERDHLPRAGPGPGRVQAHAGRALPGAVAAQIRPRHLDGHPHRAGAGTDGRRPAVHRPAASRRRRTRST